MLRLFVETLPLTELLAPGLLPRLAASVDGLVVAVRPPDLAVAARVAPAVRKAGLGFGLWPMLADTEGRWCTARNAGAFARFADAAMTRVELGAGDAFLFDLEPAFAVLEAAGRGDVRGALAAYRRERAGADTGALHELAARVAGRSVALHSAEFPWALWPGPWSRLAGVAEVRHPQLSRGLMLYTSMLEGYARPWVNRSRARRLLGALGARGLAKLGGDTELQLGAVGLGALQHEPIYRAVHELEDDLEIALAVGARRIAVFELGGMLRRSDTDRWLEACRVARDLLRSRNPVQFVPAR